MLNIFTSPLKSTKHLTTKTPILTSLLKSPSLIFPSNLASKTTPLSQRLPHIAPPPGYPETLYLDHARLAGLTSDAADLGVLYAVLMLFRQLVFGTGAKKGLVLEDQVVDRVKREVWQVGPARLGLCFSGRKQEADKDKDEWTKWRSGMRDVVLQVAVRAEQVRRNTTADVLPDAKTLALLESWMETNLQPESVLAKLFKGRLEKAVEGVVARCVAKTGAEEGAVAAGLEPLMPEIRHLGERIAKLVSFHGRVYRGLYEAEGFLV